MTTDSRQCVLDSYQHSLDNALCVGSENYLSVGVEFAQKHIAKVLIKKHKESSLQTASQSGRRLLSTL